MKTKAVWYPPQQAPDPDLLVFTTEIGEDADRTGKMLGKRYKLVRRIGSGATASVYEARNQVTGARLAVKILHRGLYEPLRGFFGQEGRIAARHNCPHLVQAIDFGEFRGAAYTVFNFADGKPLRHLAGNDGLVSSTPLPWRRLCPIILQVLEALGVLHKNGIVHRDLHSSNILVAESRDDFAVVIDVGFAAVMPGRRITQAPEPTRTIYGMYSYVAPETLAGCPPDPRIDLYAVGVLMFELLTGMEMIDYGRNFGKLAVPPLRVIAPGHQIPEAVDAIVLRALSDVSMRFASADEMATAIRTALADADADAAAVSRRRVLRPAAALGAGGAIVGGLLVGGLLLATQPSSATLAAMNTAAEPLARGLADTAPPATQQPELHPPAPQQKEVVVSPEPATAISQPPEPPTTTRPLSPSMTTAHSQLAGQQVRGHVQVSAEQRLVRKARRSILDCKPDGALADASVVIKRLGDGSVEARFNGRSVQGTFGRCVADYAKTASLGPDGVLKFSL